MRAARSTILLVLALGTFPGQAFSQMPNPTELFTQAYSFYSNGNLSAAKDIFQKTTGAKFVLADYSLYYLGLIAANEKDTARARQLFIELKQRFPQSIWAYPADLQRARIDISEKRFASVTETLRILRGDKGVPAAIAQEALFLSAQAVQDDPVQAFNLYQELRNSYPLSRWTSQARNAQNRLREQFPELALPNTVEALLTEAD